MTYTLAVPVTIFMNVPIYIRIQSFQLEHNFNQIIIMYIPIMSNINEVLNLNRQKKKVTCLNNSIGRDKAGVPLSNNAY